MKVQLEQLDLLHPWPTFVMKPGYRSVCVMLRVGTVPLGAVHCRPVRKGLVTPHRIYRRIRRSGLTVKLIKLLSIEMSRGRMLLGPQKPTDATATSVSVTEMSGRVLQEFARKHLYHADGIQEPYRSLILAAQSEQPHRRPPVTVVVCTADRATTLDGCVQSLLQLDYPNYRVLIVDNSRDPIPTRAVARKHDVDYIRAPERGLSRARNLALEVVETDWIAFTDDDCRPEPTWLSELVRPLGDANCRCVTGLVVAAQLENSAEVAFEVYGGLGRGTWPAIYEPRFLRKGRFTAAPTWEIGAGANSLMHAGLARDLGGFDVDLGAGTSCGCSEDTLLYYQMLRTGYSIHYTPRAIVHHFHRADSTALRKQLYSYAKGHAAYHLRCLVSFRDHRSLIRLVWHLPRWGARTWKRAASNRTRYPFSLVGLSLRGTVAGVFLYSAAKIRRGSRGMIDRLFNPRKKFTSTFQTDPLVGQEAGAVASLRAASLRKSA